MAVERRPLTEDAKAKALGIKRMTLWRYRNGRPVPVGIARKLARLDRQTVRVDSSTTTTKEE